MMAFVSPGPGGPSLARSTVKEYAARNMVFVVVFCSAGSFYNASKDSLIGDGSGIAQKHPIVIPKEGHIIGKTGQGGPPVSDRLPEAEYIPIKPKLEELDDELEPAAVVQAVPVPPAAAPSRQRNILGGGKGRRVRGDGAASPNAATAAKAGAEVAANAATALGRTRAKEKETPRHVEESPVAPALAAEKPKEFPMSLEERILPGAPSVAVEKEPASSQLEPAIRVALPTTKELRGMKEFPMSQEQQPSRGAPSIAAEKEPAMPPLEPPMKVAPPTKKRREIEDSETPRNEESQSAALQGEKVEEIPMSREEQPSRSSSSAAEKMQQDVAAPLFQQPRQSGPPLVAEKKVEDQETPTPKHEQPREDDRSLPGSNAEPAQESRSENMQYRQGAVEGATLPPQERETQAVPLEDGSIDDSLSREEKRQQKEESVVEKAMGPLEEEPIYIATRTGEKPGKESVVADGLMLDNGSQARPLKEGLVDDAKSKRDIPQSNNGGVAEEAIAPLAEGQGQNDDPERKKGGALDEATAPLEKGPNDSAARRRDEPRAKEEASTSSSALAEQVTVGSSPTAASLPPEEASTKSSVLAEQATFDSSSFPASQPSEEGSTSSSAAAEEASVDASSVAAPLPPAEGSTSSSVVAAEASVDALSVEAPLPPADDLLN